MHEPNKVASMVLRSEPNRLAIRYNGNGDFTAPKHMLTTSPGKKQSVRKKKHVKKEFSLCFFSIFASAGYFCADLFTTVEPEK